MMRDIKCRGINHETGEFVYGWYTKLQSGGRRYDAIISDIDGVLTEFYIHKAETIGLATGLTDETGADVYEGDLLINRYGRVCKVVWHKYHGGFDAEFLFDKSYKHDKPMAHGFKMHQLHACIYCIGNIHQNPDLLDKAGK